MSSTSRSRLRLLLVLVLTVGACGAGQPEPAAAATFTPTCGETGTPPYPAAVIADDPLAYWRMCTDGNTWLHDWPTQSDSSGHGRTLRESKWTGCCSPPLHHQSGALRNEDNFSEAYGDYSQYAMSDSAFPDQFAGAFSVELWFRPSQDRSADDGVFKEGIWSSGVGDWQLGWGGGHDGFVLRHEISYDTYGCRCYAYEDTAAPYPLHAGTWYHVVVASDGGSAWLYVNGARVATSSVSPTTLSVWSGGQWIQLSDNTWGNTTNSGRASLVGAHGLIDEVAVYDHALSYDRVRAHYAASGRALPVPTWPAPSDFNGSGPSAASPNLVKVCSGDPVNCATGNFNESHTDLAVADAGGGLAATRSYSAQGATTATSPGPLGYGWTASFTDRLSVDDQTGAVTLLLADGSSTAFAPNGDGTYSGGAWVQATLTQKPDGSYRLLLPDQQVMTFASSGRLEALTDRNGNTTTVSHDADGHLQTVTGPTGRTLTYTTYDDGTIASITDPAGHQVTYAYAHGDLTRVTDVRGNTTEFVYDAQHRLTSVTDPRGHVVTTNSYDDHDRVTAQTDALGDTTTWDYSTPGHTRITDPAGHVTDETFEHGVPVEIRKGVGTASQTTVRIAYDAALNPVRVTDGRGHDSTYEYDKAGNRTSATDPLGHTTSWTYNDEHEPTSQTAPSGRTTDFAYDAHGNLTSVTAALTETGETATTAFAYDSSGDLTVVTDPLGHEWSYGYDRHADPTAVTTPNGHTTTTAYDDNGLVVSTTSARGTEPGATPADYTSRIVRDPAGNPTEIIDPLGHHVTFRYDSDGNVTDQTDRDGRHTHFDYDAANRRTQTTRGDGSQLTTTYDDVGHVATQVDGLGHTTSYAYDPLGRLTTISDPLQRQTALAYDDNGNLTTKTDPQGRTTTYSYDAADRLTDISSSSGAPGPVSFSYDVDGHRTAVSDDTGTSRYRYDSLGRLIDQSSGAGQTVTYGYDLAGRLTSIGYPAALESPGVAGGTVTRGYDPDGNLTSVADWFGHTTRFDYDPEGNLAAVQRPNGTSATYRYDRNGLISALTDVTGQIAYSRTDEGLLASATVSGRSDQPFRYDAARRLTSAGRSAYRYDAADRLIQTADQHGQPVSQSFDAAGQLTQTATREDALRSYSYDLEGNRTGIVARHEGDSTLTWDQAGRLTTYHGPDARDSRRSVTADYTYNADGLRQTKTVNGELTHEVYDLSGGLSAMIEDGPTAYVTGPDGLPIEQLSPDGTVRYFSSDQLGSTTALTNQSGDVVARYAYDAYGNPSRMRGERGERCRPYAGRGPSSCASSCARPHASRIRPSGRARGAACSARPRPADTPFGYAGQYTDPETGLQYLRARYYDPATGQFLSRDPLTGITGQPYAYAGNEPTDLVDPAGLFPSLQSISDFVAAAGDTLTFGGTKAIRGLIGSDGTNYCSAAYGNGSTAGVVESVLIPIGGELRAGAMIERAAAPLAASAGEEATAASPVLRRIASALADERGEFDPFAGLRKQRPATSARAGDPREAMDEARRLIEKEQIARGSDPNAPTGGSRGTRLAALLARLYQSMRP